MVRFIKQEAEEKANEIGISAEEVLDSPSACINKHIWSSIHFELPNKTLCLSHRAVLVGVQYREAAATGK